MSMIILCLWIELLKLKIGYRKYTKLLEFKIVFPYFKSEIHAEREYNSRTSELYLHKYNIQNFVDQYVESWF